MEFLLIGVFIQAIVFGIFSGYIGSQKGRSGFTWFFLGLFFSLLAILALIALPKAGQESTNSNDENKPKSPSGTASELNSSLSPSLFDGPRDIEVPAYQLFLTRRFKIERNETLNKYIVGDDVFESLSKALTHSDGLYASYLDENNRKAAAEQLLRERNLQQLRMFEEAQDKEKREKLKTQENERRERQKLIKKLLPWLVGTMAVIALAVGVNRFNEKAQADLRTAREKIEAEERAAREKVEAEERAAREVAELPMRCARGEVPWIMKETQQPDVLSSCTVGGLLWTRKDNGYDIDFNNARTYCQKLGDGKWKLPTSLQLSSIQRTTLPNVDCGEHKCKVSNFFNISGRLVWASDRLGGKDDKDAWAVNLYDALPVKPERRDRVTALCVREP
jgi:hypothetical protein